MRYDKAFLHEKRTIQTDGAPSTKQQSSLYLAAVSWAEGWEVASPHLTTAKLLVPVRSSGCVHVLVGESSFFFLIKKKCLLCIVVAVLVVSCA